jgi:hypothetical protein
MDDKLASLLESHKLELAQTVITNKVYTTLTTTNSKEMLAKSIEIVEAIATYLRTCDPLPYRIFVTEFSQQLFQQGLSVEGFQEVGQVLIDNMKNLVEQKFNNPTLYHSKTDYKRQLEIILRLTNVIAVTARITITTGKKELVTKSGLSLAS